MPKQLYIPLPCAAARRQMIERQIGDGREILAELAEDELAKVVAKTEGYSGSDMRNVIQEACQGPVREAMAQHGMEGAYLHMNGRVDLQSLFRSPQEALVFRAPGKRD